MAAKQEGVEDSASLIESLFERLDDLIASEDHKAAIRTCDEILTIAPKDEDALNCKLIALMSLQNYDAGLQLLAKHPEFAANMVFEKAYCLYRSGKIEEALDVARAGSDSNGKDESGNTCQYVFACLQLQAQLHFRLGQSKEAIQAYEKLFKVHNVQSLELKTNMVAAYVAAELSSQVPALMQSMQVTSKQSFELGFNKACALIQSGQLSAAESELRMALKLGRESLLEEDLGEEEVAEELAPLSVQLGYVLGQMGRHDESAEAYEQVLANEAVTEEVVRAIAHNNVIAASGKVDGTHQQKKYVAAAARRVEGLLDKDKPGPLKLNSVLEARLSSSQKQTLHLNRALLMLLAGRIEPAMEIASILSKQQVGEKVHMALVLLRAAILAAEGKQDEAGALLEGAASGPSTSTSNSAGFPPIHPQLMRVQLALEVTGGKGLSKALELLQTLKAPEQLLFSGAVLTTRLALHKQLGDITGAEAMLDSALSYWKNNPGESSSFAVDWCLESLVGFKLKLGKVEEAVHLYKQMKEKPSSVKGVQQHTSASVSVLSSLMRALAESDPSSSLAMEKELPAITAAQLKELDLDALDQASASVSTASKGFKKKEKRDDMNVDQPLAVKEKKRKRGPIFPKGYDSSLPSGGLPPPDPERWLPKWQRSGFKKKKATSAQRKQAEAIKGSQGVGKVDEQLDRSAAPAAPPPSAKPVLPPKKKGKK